MDEIIYIRNVRGITNFPRAWWKFLFDTGLLSGTSEDQYCLGEISEISGWIQIYFPYGCNLPDEYLSFLSKTFGEKNVYHEYK